MPPGVNLRRAMSNQSNKYSPDVQARSARGIQRKFDRASKLGPKRRSCFVNKGPCNLVALAQQRAQQPVLQLRKQ